ncbi:hypothetical protein ACN27F_13185 [Solwaraspora sp. WMMB335]|uniref:hypothetical protein n=1 Tax=Solwaraspora sp. WMMB335 TaxID=3404118 RepID=UPI003B93F9F4
MDQKNPFETPNTFRLHRAEYLVGFGVSAVLLVMHWNEVRWLPAIALFLYIDLIGYIPGAIAYHRSKTKKISKVYYVLYNVMHSLITQTVVVGLWLWLIGPEWALLVIPFHVFGDRGLFGNFLKPFGMPFEPVPHPLYAKLIESIRSPGQQPATNSAPEPLVAHIGSSK